MTRAKNSKHGKLTDKQAMFCREYLKDLNATQAAIRAGYSPRTAKISAHLTLKNPIVQARIAELKTKRNDRVQVNADYVLERLVEIDGMDVADILTDEGGVKPVSQWPDVWRRTLSGLEISELFGGDGDAKQAIGALKKIKWPDKLRNLELLGRHVHVGAFKDSIDHNHKFGKLTDEDLDARIRQLTGA